MVLHHSDASFHASSLHGFEPLPGIGRFRWCKLRLGFTAIAPFGIGESVHSEMEEGIELRFLPQQLPMARHRMFGGRLVVGILVGLSHRHKLSLCLEAGGTCQACDQDVSSHHLTSSFLPFKTTMER